MWFKKKKEQIKQKVGFNAAAFEIEPKEIKVSEPHTLAQYRLDNGAKDSGAEKGVRMYNAHKAKIQNQWINPLQSINSGYGNAQLSYYNYQAVNYYECYSLAQDPLFNKIFNLLSNTPFANGGDVVADLSEEDAKLLDNACNKYKVTETITKCVRSNYVCGGCLLYLDFGDDYDLEEPLDLNKVDMSDFKGFRHIDPINITAVDVNTIDPSKDDYMSPKMWYVIGLGAVHASHFLKFEDNIPELMMKPMCLYFGMPLTLLIKQDVANSNLASQGLANLMNRFRYLYLQTSDDNFTSSNAVDFRNRLEVMSMIQDNFGIYPLKSTEQIQQFTTSLTGMDANAEFFYQVIASKTDITLSVLLGKGAQGLSGTLEGERKNWYDRVRSIQQQNKHNLLVMMGIAFGAEKDGKFVEFADYSFNPLEQSDEREKAENLKSYTEVAKSLIEVGVKTEDVLAWLKGFKDFHLENVELDDEAEDLQDFDMEQGIGTNMPEKANNAMVDNGRWITIGHKDADEDGEERKGRHLYLDDGETPKEAIDELKKGDKDKEAKKEDKPEEKKDDNPEDKGEEQPEKETKEEPKEKGEPEDITKLSDEDLDNKIDDLDRKYLTVNKGRLKSVDENPEVVKMKEEYSKTLENYYNAESPQERGELNQKLNDLMQKQKELEYSLEDKWDEEHKEEIAAIREELSGLQMERYERHERKIKISEQKRDALFERINKMMLGADKLTDEEYEAEIEDIRQAAKESDMEEYHKNAVLNTLTSRSEKQRFVRKVDGMAAKVKAYQSKNDALVKALNDIEMPSEKFAREEEDRKKALKELTEKQAAAQTDEAKKEIGTQIAEFITQNWRSSLEKRLKADENVQVTAKTLRSVLGDTGKNVIVADSKKGSVGNMHYTSIAQSLNGIIGKNINVNNPPKIVGIRGRANFGTTNHEIHLEKSDTVGTAIHEYVHFLEENNPKMIDNSRAFLEYRTKGERTESLRAITGKSYKATERTKPDKFFDAYCGKMYSQTGEYKDAYATELMSMGVQRLFEDPKGFAKEDREYFDFVVANLRGEL